MIYTCGLCQDHAANQHKQEISLLHSENARLVEENKALKELISKIAVLALEGSNAEPDDTTASNCCQEIWELCC